VREPRRQPPAKVEPPVIAGRVPVHDLDCEAAVLSAILLDRDALDRVTEILIPDHFYSEANGRIFGAASQLALAGSPVDIVSVAAWLRDREQLASIGGAGYLAQLSDATPAVAHVGAHAKKVREKWRVRQVVAACQRTAAEGYGVIEDAQAFISGHESTIRELSATNDSKGLVHIAHALQGAMSEVQSAAARGETITGVPTGYKRLDAATSGMHGGDLIIVAARPGHGKTSFLLNLGVNVASPRTLVVPNEEGFGVETSVVGDDTLIFSLEMPTVQLAIRMVCSEARIDANKLRTGHMQSADWTALTEAAAYLATLPIWIDDTPAISVQAIGAKVRAHQAARKRKVGFVGIDYIGLMQRDKRLPKHEAIGDISNTLKQMAKELDVPIVALSQLNREIEKRTGKSQKPQLSDLRDSGDVEQDADMILFIHRPEMFAPDDEKLKGIAEVIIGKQRSGPTGKVLLKFSSKSTRFDNLDPRDYPADADE